MNKSTKTRVEKSVKRFKETGKLPTEDDVVDANMIRPSDIEKSEKRYEYLHNVPEREKIESIDAALLSAYMTGFLSSLSKKEKFVYDVHIVGGLTVKETGVILSASPQAISNIKGRIRKKAKKTIKIAKEKEMVE